MTATDDVVKGFTDAFTTPPDVVWSAPGRVNLIGEHTDYNEGLVLPFAIAERTTVAVGRRDDDDIAAASALYPEVARSPLAEIGPGTVPGWPAYPLGVAWALSPITQRSGPLGIAVYISSAVPAGAGLSSSAALEVAVASALNDLWELGLAAPALARAGHKAENEVVGAPTGIMDQYASLLGQPDSAVYLDCRTEQATVVPLRLRGAGLELVLIDSGERHAHAAGGYAARRASCELAARQLGVRALRDVGPDDLPRMARLLDDETFRRARHVVTEDARVAACVAALERDDVGCVGRLLTESHVSMRDDFEITTPALDLTVEVALREGALGARMTGGGFGGSVIVLIGRDRVPALGQAVADAFSDASLGAPVIRTAIPSEGPRKEA